MVEEAGFSVQGLVFDRMERMSPLFLRKWRGGGDSMQPFAGEVAQRLMGSLLSESGDQVT